MNTLEVLQKARGLIADPARWVEGWGSMTPKGAGYTCAVGAVRTAVGLPTAPEYDEDDVLAGNKEAKAATKKLADVIGEKTVFGVISYNDSHSHECVLAMFDAAIEKERAK